MGVSFKQTAEFILKPGDIEAAADFLNDQEAVTLAGKIRSIRKLFLTSSAATFLVGGLWAASQIGAAIPMALLSTTAITFYALYRTAQPFLQKLIDSAERITKVFSEEYSKSLDEAASKGPIKEVAYTQMISRARNKALN